MTGSARNAYMSSMVSTGSPGRLVVMLYDRLLLDLQRAETAARAGDHAAASSQLMHAQEIVLELRFALREDVWDGAAGLASVYMFVHAELVRANVERNPDVTAKCHALLEPLADAWRHAALAATA